MNFAVVIQVIDFLVEHKEDIKKMVLALESLAETAAGPDKAAVIRQYIGGALNMEAQVEAAWPAIAPFFNLAVSAIKAKTA